MAVDPNKRKSGRYYRLKPTTIHLKGSQFELNDISSEGIGIVIRENSPQFINGERLDKVPIPLKKGTIHLKGVVTHISVTSESKICGIKFQFEEGEFKYIIQFKKERIIS